MLFYTDLSIYDSTALVDPGRFFSFLIYTQSVVSFDGGSVATYTHINTNTE
jgi:hypothetical protein